MIRDVDKPIFETKANTGIFAPFKVEHRPVKMSFMFFGSLVISGNVGFLDRT